jgi:hypothetical protein
MNDARDAVLDAIWERLRTSIEARCAATLNLSEQHQREIARIAINLVVRAQEGRLP